MKKASDLTRVRNLSVTFPLIYGNTAQPLTQKQRESLPSPEHTHQWKLFVSGVQDDFCGLGDKGCIRLVEFKLHDTFKEPNRVVREPPFEITETGWGEFEVIITISFHPSSGEKPITLYHLIRLYPNELAGVVELGEGLIRAETYDEIVFNEPTEGFYNILTENADRFTPPKKRAPGSLSKFCQEMEKEELERLEQAQIKLSQQLKLAQERLENAERELNALR